MQMDDGSLTMRYAMIVTTSAALLRAQYERLRLPRELQLSHRQDSDSDPVADQEAGCADEAAKQKCALGNHFRHRPRKPNAQHQQCKSGDDEEHDKRMREHVGTERPPFGD